MTCLHLDDCKEGKMNLKGCFNPSGWKRCKVYRSLFMLDDLLEMLKNTQGFDGTIKDLNKMKNINKLYELRDKNTAIYFEVEVVNPRYAFGLSINDANMSHSRFKPEHNGQQFTGNWKSE